MLISFLRQYDRGCNASQDLVTITLQCFELLILFQIQNISLFPQTSWSYCRGIYVPLFINQTSAAENIGGCAVMWDTERASLIAQFGFEVLQSAVSLPGSQCCVYKKYIYITNQLESFIYWKISHSKSGKFYRVICEKASWVKCSAKPRHHCWLWSSQWIKWPLHFLGLGLKPWDCNSLVPAAVSLTMQWDSIR